MSDREIDLQADQYRSIPQGPLGKPSHLWASIIVCLFASCVCAVGAWIIGGPFAALLPIPPAVYAGIGIAGLYPGYWFKRDR